MLTTPDAMRSLWFIAGESLRGEQRRRGDGRRDEHHAGNVPTPEHREVAHRPHRIGDERHRGSVTTAAEPASP